MEATYINKISDINNKNFKENFFIPQKPVVIKGLTRLCPANEKWTMEYIKQKCGDVIVDVFDNSKVNKASAFTKPDTKMKFIDYVNILLENKPSPLRIFLFNMFKKRPSLRKDFPCPEIFKGILGRIGFMFFGAKNVKVRIHQDIDMSNVLLTQFHGKKKVVLIAPEYSDFLYKLPFNTFSLIDLDKPDYEKYPGLRYIKTQECILDPGDSLFIPSGYWHYITYLEGGFSVSYRKLAYSFGDKLMGLINLCLYMPIDKLLISLLGEKWVCKKEKIAQVRANQAIKKLRGKEYKNSITAQLLIRLGHYIT